MFQGRLRGGLREPQGNLKISKGVLRKFQGCIKNVSCVFSRKLQIKFKECFKNILMKFCFCSFVVAWISSQLLEQKEGLFLIKIAGAISSDLYHA